MSCLRDSSLFAINREQDVSQVGGKFKRKCLSRENLNKMWVLQLINPGLI